MVVLGDRLEERGVPWARLTGSHTQRLDQAIKACDDLFARYFRYAGPLG